MEVSPDSSVNNSPRRDHAAAAREDLTDEFSEEEEDPTRGRPRRKAARAVVNYAEITSPRKKVKEEPQVVVLEEEEEEDEEDSKPAALENYPVGVRIEKEFYMTNGTMSPFKGRVVAGPTLKNNEKLWDILYDDGDDEQMNLQEIKQHMIVDEQDRRTTTASQGTARGRPRRRGQQGPKAAKNGKVCKEYQTAYSDLIWKMGITEEEVKAALDSMKPPYGLNEAMRRIQEARNTNTYVPRGKFQIQKGMRIRVPKNGAFYHGTVTKDEPEWKNDPITGDDVKMWEVKFEEDEYGKELFEDYEYDDLRRYYAERPIRTHPIRGRPLRMLELFCGQGIVSQEFCELKWYTRSIDNNPDTRVSYPTDLVDIMKLQFQDIGAVPDFLWASPPCQTYSTMAGGTHRGRAPGEQEKTVVAHEHNRLLIQMFAIMKWALSKKPHMIIAMENPQGLLPHMPLMQDIEKELGLHKVLVNYCAFGRDDKKPTYIWSNSWKLRAALSTYTCANNCPYKGGTHPVGARSHGRQYNAAAIPQYLAEEVANCVHADFYDRRIHQLPEVELTEAEIEAFNALMLKC